MVTPAGPGSNPGAVPHPAHHGSGWVEAEHNFPMPFPTNHWFYFLKSHNTHRLSTMLEVLEHRLLPCFQNIEAEAQGKSDEAWESLSEMACGEDGPLIDESEAAEMAQAAGYEHYEALTGARQTLLNSFAVSIYHLWEQQLLAFHRRQLLRPWEQMDARLFTLKEVEKRLQAAGVEASGFESWKEMTIYRLLANTIKHADGDSAERLKALRPQWFTSPYLKDSGLPFLGIPPSRIYLPLAGEDVFVSIEDIRMMVGSAVQFWTDLVSGLEAAQDPQN